ncbi:Bifunctional aspartokinase/homoserine dehydrogenase 1 [Buchnera aphidicola (Eriosoma grossulariae)]|uniref:bifunctional aspartate kinase/homoserine dehydrogenase I n=1 Tax=Buchnera aphidicola TaxID=9 RepID=UPI00346460DD
MKVLKFGGTSLKNADKFLHVSDIITNDIKKEQLAIVLSAPSKITNYLVKMTNHKINNDEISNNIQEIKYIFNNIVNDIYQKKPKFLYQPIIQLINDQLIQLKKIIYSVQILKTCPKNIYAFIVSRGEILSIAIMEAILTEKNYAVTIINPIKKLLSTGDKLDSIVDIEQSSINIESIKIPKTNIILMPGFIAGNKKKELVVLGRNGSDYSAAILAACLKARKLEIWTDVDGIYTCDPRIVLNACLIKKISYQESMELSYFGAKVLHPKTIFPIMKFNIPCIIKNTNNPKGEGTLISNTNNLIEKIDSIPASITGITHLNDVIMLNISSLEIKNIPKVTNRILSSIEKHKIWIMLLTQSSSESNLNFCILEKQLSKTIYILKNEFQLEIKNNLVSPIKIIKKLSIISIIGKKIKLQSNIFSKIFSVLNHHQVKILAIAQGSSDHTISIVINEKYTMHSIKAIHEKIFNDNQVMEIFLLGIGGVGKVLLSQLKKQINYLKRKKIQIKICGIANSKKLLLNLQGIDLNAWENNFYKSNLLFDFQEIKKILKNNYIQHPIIIDCTSSQIIADQYIEFLSSGFHVVTSNKKANTQSYEYYQTIRKTAFVFQKKFLYETNVGAGLPIIENLQKLISTGDKFLHFRGVLSGSLSFIFGELDNNTSFSNATIKAKKLGFTEPDPRDDLSGIDVARKLLILAREVGYKIELNDIKIESILPKYFDAISDINQFMVELKKLDNLFYKKFNQAKKFGKVLRYVGIIDLSGECQVRIEEIDENDPLYKIKNGENALAFYSQYYQPMPLVLRGYGAGNNVTAAGVFSDLLRTL